MKNKKQHYAKLAWKASNRLQYWAYLRGRISQMHRKAKSEEERKHLLDVYSFCFRREIRSQTDIHSAVFHITPKATGKTP